jgi:crotonobetaine/carnitine-CoA ligase
MTSDELRQIQTPAEMLLETPLAQQNLPTLLERRADEFGDKLLARVAGDERTYAGARDVAARTAGMLAAAGIKAGDCVAIIAGNRVEQFDLFLGCAWLGAIAVPLDTALRGAQLEHCLHNSGAVVLVIEAALTDILEPIAPPPSLRELWTLDGPPGALPDGYRLGAPPAAADPLPLRRVPPGETAIILYTSGTTGPSKGVMCPQAQLYWFATTMSEAIGIEQTDVLYNCMPLYHINAMLTPFEALSAGASADIDERFTASRYWERTIAAGATVIFLLGALPSILVAQPPRDADRRHRVKTLFAPGTPAPVWAPFMERFGVAEIIEGYGSTETNHCIGRAPGHRVSQAGHMGWVFDRYFEARVADGHDIEVPPDTPGELLLRPKHPFAFSSGYWKMPDRTAEAYRNFWFHTGDRVARSADGCLRFVDRLKDSMRRLGENVSAWEVEEALLRHAAIGEAAVFGVPAPDLDEEIMAVLVLRDGRRIDFRELVAFLEPRLAYFAIPRYFDLADELPHTENGKLQKGALRARGVTDTTWDREAAGITLRRRRARASASG